jgi:hypothetical protein
LRSAIHIAGASFSVANASAVTPKTECRFSL